MCGPGILWRPAQMTETAFMWYPAIYAHLVAKKTHTTQQLGWHDDVDNYELTDVT
jgi:hypothetical protein